MGGCGNILSPIIAKARRSSRSKHLINLCSIASSSNLINSKIKIKRGAGKGVFATIVEKRGSRLLAKGVNGNKFYKIQEGDYEFLPTRAKIESSIVLQKIMNDEVEEFVLDDEIINQINSGNGSENSLQRRSSGTITLFHLCIL